MKIRLKQAPEYSMVVRGEVEEGFVIPGVPLGDRTAVLTEYECRFSFDGAAWVLSDFKCRAVPGNENGQIDQGWPFLSHGLEARDGYDQEWMRLLVNSVKPVGGSWAPITEFEVPE
jgi:hypothetical protein